MSDANPIVITVHRNQHRERSLAVQDPGREAEDVYDANITQYFQFLHEQAAQHGYRFVIDAQGGAHDAFSYSGNREQRQAAHDWLHTQPDFWNWLP